MCGCERVLCGCVGVRESALWVCRCERVLCGCVGVRECFVGVWVCHWRVGVSTVFVCMCVHVRCVLH